MDTNKTNRAARFNARLAAVRASDVLYAAACARCDAQNAVLRARDAADLVRLQAELARAGLRARPETYTNDENDEVR